MIWMISLRMFFVFKVEVLEVLGGFKAWFQQSFWTSQSWSPLKCLRKAFIYRSLGGGWQSLIGDTCHSLIGLLMSSLTCAGLHMSSLTRAGLLMLSLTCVDV